MTRAAAKTGAGPTMMVAVEQYFPKKQRITEDSLAYQILPFGIRTVAGVLRSAPARDWMVQQTERSLPGIWGGMMCRKRYIDEKLTETSRKIEAVVNLGAGFDTRAYRLPALANLPIWEVDQPENIKPKHARLLKLFGEVPSHVRLVPTDFDREELSTVLRTHGYPADQQTFFIWEAVTQYLTEAGVRGTFDFLAKVPSGSLLAFTYVRKDFIEGKNKYEQEAAYEQYITKDKFWLFGIYPEEIPGFLETYGWRVIEHLGYEELAERYVKPTGRELASTPIERMVYAEKSVSSDQR